MTLNPNMLSTMKPIAEATATAGFMFVNPKSPIVRALEKDGFILPTGQPDPSNKDKFSYAATAVGMEAAGVSTINPNQGTSNVETQTIGANDVGTLPAGVVGAATEKKPRAPRAVRPPPSLAHTGIRMAMPVSLGRTGRTPREEIYPFSKLEAPNAEGHDSFFITATSHLPNPAKQLASTVGSANKRFKAEGRVFKIVAIATDVEHNVAGARVVRVK